MKERMIHTTVDILGKTYPIRCSEKDAPMLQKAAEYLHQQMLEVQNSGKVINLERIALITALNLARQLLEQDQEQSKLVTDINNKISQLRDKLDVALSENTQLEMVYSDD